MHWKNVLQTYILYDFHICLHNIYLKYELPKVKWVEFCPINEYSE